MAEGLRHGPLGAGCLHLCIDMQRIFGPGSPWAVDWMGAVLPSIQAICARHAAATVFTRFVPPRRPEDLPGTWRLYYERWREMTLDNIDPARVDLVPELARFAPPARLLDKRVYSPWQDGALDRLLHGSGIDTLILTGGETDLCVLAALLGAVDRGYRTILVADAVCSSADDSHDALLKLYGDRFSQQVEVVDTAALLSHWSPAPPLLRAMPG